MVRTWIDRYPLPSRRPAVTDHKAIPDGCRWVTPAEKASQWWCDAHDRPAYLCRDLATRPATPDPLTLHDLDGHDGCTYDDCEVTRVCPRTPDPLLKAARAVVDAYKATNKGFVAGGDGGYMDRPHDHEYARPEGADPSCCELACYEDEGCMCDGCAAQPAPDQLREAAPTLMAVHAEVGRARGLFPRPDGLLAALVEEVGEVARALLSESDQRVREECIQVAAMAIRLAEEGDPTLAALRAAIEEADR